jgi:hypothetical protein
LKLKEANAQIRLDTFIDPSLVRKVSGIVRDMLRERLPVRGREAGNRRDARRTEACAPDLPHGGRSEGQDPQRRLIGNKAVSDATLKAQMKQNRSGPREGRCASADLVHVGHRPRHVPGAEVR